MLFGKKFTSYFIPLLILLIFLIGLVAYLDYEGVINVRVLSDRVLNRIAFSKHNTSSEQVYSEPVQYYGYELSAINTLLKRIGLGNLGLGMTLSEAKRILEKKKIKHYLLFSNKRWAISIPHLHKPRATLVGDAEITLIATPLSRIVYTIMIDGYSLDEKLDPFLEGELGRPDFEDEHGDLWLKSWYRQGVRIGSIIHYSGKTTDTNITFDFKRLEKRAEREAKKLQTKLKEEGLTYEQWAKKEKEQIEGIQSRPKKTKGFRKKASKTSKQHINVLVKYKSLLCALKRRARDKVEGKPINTVKEFENSKYYKFMSFVKKSNLPTKATYKSSRRKDISVVLTLKNGKITISSITFLVGKEHYGFRTFCTDVFLFVANMTGVTTKNEIDELARKLIYSLTGGPGSFLIKGKEVRIEVGINECGAIVINLEKKKK